MSGTKKVRSSGRFGPRYGKKIRSIVADIEQEKKSNKCPYCGAQSLNRKDSAMWACKKCGARFVGGTFRPHTKVGSIVKRVLQSGNREEFVKAINEVQVEEKKVEGG